MKINLKNLFLQHLKTKVMALVMAVLVWLLAYHFSIAAVEDVKVPLVITPPEGWTVVTAAATQRITFQKLEYRKGASKDVEEALRSGELRVECAIKLERESGDVVKQEIILNDEHFRVPRAADARVVKFKPRSVTVTIAREATKWLSVRLQIGKLAEGHELDESATSTWPETVEVTGPKFVLDQVSEVATKPVVRTTPANLEDVIGLEPFVKLGNRTYPVTTSARAVSFDLRLRPKRRETRVFKGIPIGMYVLNFGQVATFAKERTVNVTARGRKADLEKLKPKDIRVWATVTADMTPKEMPWKQPLEWQVRGDVGKSVDLELDPDVVDIQIQAASAK